MIFLILDKIYLKTVDLDSHDGGLVVRLSNFSFVWEIFALEVPIVIFAAKIFERKSFFLRGALFGTVVVAVASDVDRVTLHFGGRTVTLSCEIGVGRRRKISYWAPVDNLKIKNILNNLNLQLLVLFNPQAVGN